MARYVPSTKPSKHPETAKNPVKENLNATSDKGVDETKVDPFQ